MIWPIAAIALLFFIAGYVKRANEERRDRVRLVDPHRWPETRRYP